MTRPPFHAAAPILVLLIVAGCTANRSSTLELQCAKGLDSAFQELKIAESKGFRGTVGLTQAAGLLTAAKVQYEFKRYPNCVEKVRRARAYRKGAGRLTSLPDIHATANLRVQRPDAIETRVRNAK